MSEEVAALLLISVPCNGNTTGGERHRTTPSTALASLQPHITQERRSTRQSWALTSQLCRPGHSDFGLTSTRFQVERRRF